MGALVSLASFTLNIFFVAQCISLRNIQSDTLDIQLDDRPPFIEWPRHGARLRVSLGYQESVLDVMGDYVLDEIEYAGPARTLTLKAKAADMTAMLKAPKTRHWEEVTLGDVVQTIASEHGLTAKVGSGLGAIYYAHIAQTHESDLHLLTRLAKANGALIKPVSGYLVLVNKGEARSISGQALPVIPVNATQVLQYRFTQAERGKYRSVSASWHDTENAVTRTVFAGHGKPEYRIRHPFDNEVLAYQAASAKLGSLQRGTATLSLTLLGNSALRAEGKVMLDGIRSPVDGMWVVNSVEHVLEEQGFQSRLDAELSNDT